MALPLPLMMGCEEVGGAGAVAAALQAEKRRRGTGAAGQTHICDGNEVLGKRYEDCDNSETAILAQDIAATVQFPLLILLGDRRVSFHNKMIEFFHHFFKNYLYVQKILLLRKC